MELISIAAATPGQVEAFRYQDGGMERNIQDELDARLDHIYVARVVNWPIANESEWGLTGWTPADSLLLYLSSNNLFVTKGLAYMGGRHLEAGGELFSAADPATDTYYVYLKYTFSSDTFEYEYATTKPTDTNLVKHLMLGTADWSTVTKFWTNAIDLRASNTSLGAPATVSGSDVGAIFTVENTGAGDGLLVKNSDAVIGESGVPQQLIIQGDGTKALTIYNSANSVEMVCSAANQLKIQTIAGAAAEILVDSLDTGGPVLNSTGLNMGAHAIVGATATDTINGIVISSGVIDTGTWQGTAVANTYVAGLDQNCLQASSPEFAGLTLTGNIITSGLVDSVDVSTFKTSYDSHAANANAHHAQSHNLASHSDVVITGPEVEDLTAFGSANATWINCPLESWNVLAAFRTGSLNRVWNTGATNGHVCYSVPLPTNRGGKKLYISGTRVSLAVADANNFVSRTNIVGQAASTSSYLDSDHTDKNTVDCHEDVSMGALDCSSQHVVKVNVESFVATGSQLGIQFVTVRYYYA